MNLSSAKLPSGRWGIYDDSRLLATVGCPVTLDRIHTQLSGSERRWLVTQPRQRTESKSRPKYSVNTAGLLS